MVRLILKAEVSDKAKLILLYAHEFGHVCRDEWKRHSSSECRMTHPTFTKHLDSLVESGHLMTGAKHNWYIINYRHRDLRSG